MTLAFEEVLSQLAESSPRIAALTVSLTSTQLHTTPSDDGWSANDVLAHLRACADVWGGCIVRIIREDTPRLRAISPRTWIRKTNYRELDFSASFRSFAVQRADLLAVLRALPDAGWSRAATVTGAGNVVDRTVLSYAQSLADHERQHVNQLECIVKSIHLS
jgi:hypothetical protein